MLTSLLLSFPTPAFDFYQRRPRGDSSPASALLRSGPYVPQCDAFGSWEPVQCHARTGERGRVPSGGRVTPSFSFRGKSPTEGASELGCKTPLVADGKFLSFSGLWLSHLYNGNSDLLLA